VDWVVFDFVGKGAGVILLGGFFPKSEEQSEACLPEGRTASKKVQVKKT
jgi:hypothetical protein